MPASLYLCLHLRDFAARAMEYAQPEFRRRPLAVLSGEPPLQYVFGVNSPAREAGVRCGMSRLQAESFAGVAIRPRDRALEDRAFAHLVECAGRFSPRTEAIAAPRGVPGKPVVGLLGQFGVGWKEHSCEATLVLDIANSSRLLGTAEQIARAVERELRAAEFEASIAISCNAYAAVLAARGNPPQYANNRRTGDPAGITIIPPGREAQTLAPLPITVLEPAPEQEETLAAWGIRTLGQLAALPSRSLAARLGQSGLRLQAQARGEYNHLLVPTEEPAAAPRCAGIELELPVELLEPLLFLINQLLQQVLEGAEQRALAIASLELCLVLEQKIVGHLPAVGRCGNVDRRTIRPALPERDRLVLLKLIQLELELRPPASAVAALRLVAHPARPQTAQQGLFAAQAPEPGRMAVLLARLRKLVGEGRTGSPELLDSRAPEAFRMAGFAPESAASRVPYICPPLADVGEKASFHNGCSPALRMLRPPREVAVELCRGAPVAMRCEGQRRTVQASSGPWRTSGEWWTHPGWCREEWEVVLDGDATQRTTTLQTTKLQNETLRLAHDPANGGWYVIGIYD